MHNNEVCKAMNIPTLAIGVRNAFKKCKGKQKENGQVDSEEYVPEQEEQSEEETLKIPEKVCRG